MHGTENDGLVDLVVGKIQKFFSDCFYILSEILSKIIRSERQEQKVPEKKRSSIKRSLWKVGKCIYQDILLFLALVNTHLRLSDINSKGKPWAWLYNFLEHHSAALVQKTKRATVDFKQNWDFFRYKWKKEQGVIILSFTFSLLKTS